MPIDNGIMPGFEPESEQGTEQGIAQPQPDRATARPLPNAATPPFLPEEETQRLPIEQPDTVPLAGIQKPRVAPMAAAANKAISNSAGQPGDWARGILSGAMKSIGEGLPELMAGFGAAGKVPPGAGALYGVGAAARQMEQSQMERKVLSDREKLWQSQEARDKAAMAESYLRMYQTREQMTDSDPQHLDAMGNQGLARLDHLVSSGSGSIQGANIPEADLVKEFKNGTIQKQGLIPILVGKQQVGTDPTTGMPVYAGVYSLFKPTGNVKIGPDAAKLLQDSGLFPAGQTPVSMPPGLYAQQIAKAHQIQLTKIRTQDELTKLGIDQGKFRDKQQSAEAYAYIGSVQSQLRRANGYADLDPLDTLTAIQHTAQMKDPKTGKFTPQALMAQKMWPTVVQIYGSERGIGALRHQRAEEIHQQSSNSGKQTPQEKLNWSLYQKASEAREQALNQWDREKTKLSALPKKIGDRPNPKYDAQVNAVKTAAGNFSALDTDAHNAYRNYLASVGQRPAQQAAKPKPNAVQQTLPPHAAASLKEGVHTTFGNGQVWTLQNGQPVRVK